MTVRRTSALIFLFIFVNMPFGETATQNLEKADLLYEAGQYGEAQELYRKGISEAKDPADGTHALFQLGQCLTSQGKYVDAIGIFESLINKYPNSKEVESALYRKGCILAGFLKEVERGIECFEELLKRFPHGEYADDASYFIGSIHFAKKKYTKAQDTYQKFLTMYPTSPYSNVARQNLDEIQKSKGRGPALTGKPVELEFQGTAYTITKNDSQSVGVAVGDGSIYRFQANLSGAWKTSLHTHGVWITSEDGKELTWLSDQSGVQPLVEPPCPSGQGQGGGPCPCQLPDCVVGTMRLVATPDKVCVGSGQPSYSIDWGTSAGYTKCSDYSGINTSTPEVQTATVDVCCTDCTGDHPQTLSTNVTVVEVASVSAGGITSTTATPGPNETLYVCKGASGATITITATPNPAGGWPNGSPTWTNATGIAQGTSPNITYPTATFPIDTAISTTVTATCGTSSKAMKIIVVNVEIENTDPRNSDNMQIQHLKLNGSDFSLYAIPAKIYYKILPSSGWTPDSVTLKVKSGQTVIRSQTLSTYIGEQDDTWDGKKDDGSYVDYGDYYIFIEVKKGTLTCNSNEQYVKVYEIRLGNCVYRDKQLGPEEHAGILYRYAGTQNSVTELDDDSNYIVLEQPGGSGTTHETTLYYFKSLATYRGTYCPSGLTKSEREAILEKGKALYDQNNYYVQDFTDVLEPIAPGWSGTISDIDRIRCDGISEVAYEDAGKRLYGDNNWWNIMSSQSNLNKHNDGTDSITPSKQRSSSLTTNVADSLYKP